MKKILLIVLACCMLLAACSGGEQTNGGKVGNLDSYPLESDVTLTYFRNPPPALSTLVSNYGETNFAKNFAERVGVNIEYIQPAVGQLNEAFNLMMASGEYADMMEVNWLQVYAGGPSKAINDGTIVDLKDYKEYAPALFGILEKNEDYMRQIQTDDGRVYGFPLITGSPRQVSTTGPTVRKDWLDDLGLPVPETIGDWEIMLAAFRDEKGASAPMSFNYTNGSYHMFTLLSAVPEMYVDNGTVKFGPVQPEYREALKTLNKWYSEGLLDKNIASVDDKMLGSQLLNGATGASFLSGGREIGQYMVTGVEKDPNFDLMGVKWPTFEKGKMNECIPVAFPIGIGTVSAVSAQSKSPELAVKVLDYLYTEEGNLFASFGVEGDTHTMVDGRPVYTEKITNNPEGLTMSQALAMNVKAGSSGSFMTSEDYLDQYYQLPQQKAALSEWVKGYEESMKRRIPNVTPSLEESSEYASIMNEVNKYVNQMVPKFIMGLESLEEYDAFLEQIKKLKIDRAVEIQQGAYERYMNR